jgi:hypothetical protein
MKMRRFLFFGILSLLLITVTGYGIGYLIGRYISKSFSDVEWQKCGSPPGRITQMWLNSGDLYVEMENKSIYTTWEHFDTCNFYLMKIMYEHQLSPVAWPKNQNEFWVLASSEEASLSKENSSTHDGENCVYEFQPKAVPRGSVRSLTFAYCGMYESHMSQFVLLENGQVMTLSRTAGDLMPTDPITTFPIFFSEVCGSLGLIILLLVLIFKGFKSLLVSNKHGG